MEKPTHKSVAELVAEQYAGFGCVPRIAPAAALPAKLHLGCGENPLPGWLNTDYQPGHPEVRRLDATQPFPFSDESFDCIYSEHMIEHIPYPSGLLMLAECYRTLAPGGRLRIATPDMNFLVALYRQPDEPLHRDYIRWANALFCPHATAADPLFVVNNFVRCWGHVFIYDPRTLEEALRALGFAGIRRVPLNASDRPELAGLANEQRMPAGFLDLETMVYEAERPPGAPTPAWLAGLPRTPGAPVPVPEPRAASPRLRALYRALRPLPLVGPLLERLKRTLRQG